ncbi:hypothetical protein THTE_2777 [Thermogutta terrifontis]|uniref:Uncharacterized protein n=1 Tax=Thermogutta terrifontis TaxID=1331910 RepID=A0A286RHD9_9BACT|nr:hypothetical protein THTE_2777 [Thermogutta terrifontis]
MKPDPSGKLPATIKVACVLTTLFAQRVFSKTASGKMASSGERVDEPGDAQSLTARAKASPKNSEPAGLFGGARKSAPPNLRALASRWSKSSDRLRHQSGLSWRLRSICIHQAEITAVTVVI